jgi:hypothetical protein
LCTSSFDILAFFIHKSVLKITLSVVQNENCGVKNWPVLINFQAKFKRLNMWQKVIFVSYFNRI